MHLPRPHRPLQAHPLRPHPRARHPARRPVPPPEDPKALPRGPAPRRPIPAGSPRGRRPPGDLPSALLPVQAGADPAAAGARPRRGRFRLPRLSRRDHGPAGGFDGCCCRASGGGRVRDVPEPNPRGVPAEVEEEQGQEAGHLCDM